MVQLVIENLRPSQACRFIFPVLRDHLEKFDLERKLKQWAGPQTVIIPVDGTTEGAACTVLLAREVIENDEALIIANSDQWVDCSADLFLNFSKNQDGVIMTMEGHTPEWSYVRTDQKGFVVEVAEKKVISNTATVGIYYFKHGRDFTAAADAMIAAKDRTHQEFYVAPVYNYMIRNQARIITFNIGSVGNGMFSFGTPPLLEGFLKLPISQRAALCL